MIDAMNFATDGWEVPGKPPRQGYYARTGDPSVDYLATKMDWINDRAPGTTVFSSMFGGVGLPTIDYLAGEIMKREDVEFFIKDVASGGMTTYHVLTLVGIVCVAAGNCSATYQDPNDPAQAFMSMLEMTGGRLEFDSVLYGRVFIDAAFSESPVPEPSTLLLLGFSLAGLGGFAWRRQCRK
jgi:hypothetical protein